MDRPGGCCRSSWTLKWPFSIWYRPNPTQLGILSPSPASGGSKQQSAEFVASSQVGTNLNNVDTTNSPTTQRTRTVKSQRCARAWVSFSSKNICPSLLVELPPVSNSSLSPYLTHNYPPRYFPPIYPRNPKRPNLGSSRAFSE